MFELCYQSGRLTGMASGMGGCGCTERKLEGPLEVEARGVLPLTDVNLEWRFGFVS